MVDGCWCESVDYVVLVSIECMLVMIKRDPFRYSVRVKVPHSVTDSSVILHLIPLSYLSRQA